MNRKISPTQFECVDLKGQTLRVSTTWGSLISEPLYVVVADQFLACGLDYDDARLLGEWLIKYADANEPKGAP